jgi:signal transduction histidine kinase
MLMPASSEFVALCRSQLVLIVKSLGAASCAVYLAEEFADVSRRTLIPVALYPETLDPPTGQPVALEARPATALAVAPNLSVTAPATTPAMPATLPPPSQPNPEGLVIPLLHNQLVFGILVARRPDRDWTDPEQTQLAEVAHTLALACLLDQRHQWLQQSDYQQRSFLTRQYDTLANLLHQIRNPLTTVRTLAKLLFKRQTAGSKEQEMISNILQESEHLQQLLQQFDQTIDVGEAVLDQAPEPPSQASPQPGQIPLLPPSPVGTTLTLQPVDLLALLQPLLLAGQARAEEQQQILQWALPNPPCPPVWADAAALREVLGNVFDNALKYTPAGGQVYVSLTQALSAANPDTKAAQVITISDTGPGIPAADLPHLGERHYRGTQAQGSIPGTGLGLAIARDLMAQMQGSLEIASPAIWQPSPTEPAPNPAFGPGSSFVITLPEVPALNHLNQE